MFSMSLHEKDKDLLIKLKDSFGLAVGHAEYIKKAT